MLYKVIGKTKVEEDFYDDIANISRDWGVSMQDAIAMKQAYLHKVDTDYWIKLVATVERYVFPIF